MSFRFGSLLGSASRNYTLKHINHNSTETLYKFEVVGIPNEYVEDFSKEERHYTINAINLNHWSDSATKEYKITDKIYAYYKGYSAGNGTSENNTLSFRIENNDQKLYIKQNQEIESTQKNTEESKATTSTPDQSNPKSKRISGTAETIGATIVGIILLIGFIAFFVWIGKENKEREEEYNKPQDTEQREQNNKINLTDNDANNQNTEPEKQLNQAQIDIINLQNQYKDSQEEGNNLKISIDKTKNPSKDETTPKTEIELKNRIMQLEARLKLAQNNSFDGEAVKQIRAENSELRRRIEEYTANDDYRKRYPAQYLCESGHWVRSKSEREICNFLFQHRIRYVFEKEYVYNPKSYPYYPDFYLPDYNLFIEYFGIHEDPQYNEKTKRKLDIYSNDTTHRFEFITFADDNRLQERLREICQKYNIPLT